MFKRKGNIKNLADNIDEIFRKDVDYVGSKTSMGSNSATKLVVYACIFFIAVAVTVLVKYF